MSKPPLPDHLYDLKTSLAHGGPIRAIGYLQRLRAEYLLAQPEGALGRRRALHAVALLECVWKAHQQDFTTGYFHKELKEQVDRALKTAHLQPEESHFNDLNWWGALHDKEAVRQESRSNLERLVNGERDGVTECIKVGIEIHVLTNLLMRWREGDAYTAYLDAALWSRSEIIRAAERDFYGMLVQPKAA